MMKELQNSVLQIFVDYYISKYIKKKHVKKKIETSPKGFSASKCDVWNWIYSKLGIFEKLSGNFLNFFGIFWGFCFGFFLDFVWRNFVGRNFFGRIFSGGFFREDFFGRIFLRGILCLHC